MHLEYFWDINMKTSDCHIIWMKEPALLNMHAWSYTQSAAGELCNIYIQHDENEQAREVPWDI